MRKIIATTVMTATFAAGLGIVGAGPVAAAERVCRGSIGAVTLDNVTVPFGATCTLTGTRVLGSIVVEEGGTLNARGVRVAGNIQGEGAKAVNVTAASQISGGVEVLQGGSALVRDSIIASGIVFDQNAGSVRAIGNRVSGDLQVFQNLGGAIVRSNTVGGNLQCQDNLPAPTGGANLVLGNKEDQCARL